MVSLVVFVVLFVSVSSQHTKEFNENWELRGNTNSYFFHPDTFGLNIYPDPCTKVTKRSDFIKQINLELDMCEGQWCIDESFKCRFGDSRNCYNMEHIIDTNGGEFPSNQTNIAANLVMAWGSWNQALGRLAYIDSQNEKITVYGQDAVMQAKEWIRNCASTEKTSDSTKYWLIIWFIFAIILLSTTSQIVFWLTRKVRQDISLKSDHISLDKLPVVASDSIRSDQTLVLSMEAIVVEPL